MAAILRKQPPKGAVSELSDTDLGAFVAEYRRKVSPVLTLALDGTGAISDMQRFERAVRCFYDLSHDTDPDAQHVTITTPRSLVAADDRARQIYSLATATGSDRAHPDELSGFATPVKVKATLEREPTAVNAPEWFIDCKPTPELDQPANSRWEQWCTDPDDLAEYVSILQLEKLLRSVALPSQLIPSSAELLADFESVVARESSPDQPLRITARGARRTGELKGDNVKLAPEM
jgi:hypothetical protein